MGFAGWWVPQLLRRAIDDVDGGVVLLPVGDPLAKELSRTLPPEAKRHWPGAVASRRAAGRVDFQSVAALLHDDTCRAFFVDGDGTATWQPVAAVVETATGAVELWSKRHLFDRHGATDVRRVSLVDADHVHHVGRQTTGGPTAVAALEAMLTRQTCLTSLDVFGATTVTTDFIAAIAAQHPGLEEIDLSYVSSVACSLNTDWSVGRQTATAFLSGHVPALESALSQLAHLRTVRLEGLCTDGLAAAAAVAKALHAAAAPVEHLSPCPTATTLLPLFGPTLQHCALRSDADVALLERRSDRLPQLQSVEVAYVTADVISGMLQRQTSLAARLVRLTIRRDPGFIASVPDGGGGASPLALAPQLQHYAVHGETSDEAAATALHFAGMTRPHGALRSLHLEQTGERPLSSAFLRLLAVKCPQLEHVTLVLPARCSAYVLLAFAGRCASLETLDVTCPVRPVDMINAQDEADAAVDVDAAWAAFRASHPTALVSGVTEPSVSSVAPPLLPSQRRASRPKILTASRPPSRSLPSGSPSPTTADIGTSPRFAAP